MSYRNAKSELTQHDYRQNSKDGGARGGGGAGVLTRKALAKFELIDEENTGWLGGDSLLELANWIAHELRPGQQITASMRLHQATDLLKACDASRDGAINARDFAAYYDKTASAFLRNPQLASPAKKSSKATSSDDTDEAVLSVLSARALTKFTQLSDDGSSISGDKLLELAEWVANSFRPGLKINAQQRLQEAAKIMRQCDKDDNGYVSLEDFVTYYDTTAASMLKTHQRLNPTSQVSPSPSTPFDPTDPYLHSQF